MLLADSDGADPRLTGAPGESNCTSCHLGTALNRGGGSVTIRPATGSTAYTPGVTQRLQVQVSDSAQRRWGFELSARSGTGSVQAGKFTPSDGNTHVETSGGIQFMTHTLSGTRNGTTGGVTFEFDWAPPATDVGPVTLYAAGNAANGNNQNTGDHIYTTSLVLTPASTATSNKPAIKPAGGVVNGASFQSSVAPGTWITIAGTNLSNSTREWTAADLADGKLPTSLDNVSVTINGKPAYLRYISPTQINALAPADDTQGTVEVRVVVDGQSSDPVTTTLQSFAPAFFSFEGKHLAATHADGGLLGAAGLFASAPTATTPAKPGETVILYGTGFGPADPVVPAGQFADQLAAITTPVNLTIGGLPATIAFAGVVPPFAQLYQFNVVVPEATPDGDQPVIVQIGGVTSLNNESCCFIKVQR